MSFGDRCFAVGMAALLAVALGVGLAARAPSPAWSISAAAEPKAAAAAASFKEASGAKRMVQTEVALDDGVSEFWTQEELERWERGRSALGVRESPPKDVGAYSSPVIQSARALTEAARAAARAAPGCVGPKTYRAGAGTPEEGWSLNGARVETRRKGCGPEQMEAAWRAVDASGAPALGAFLTSQDLTLEQTWALAGRLESGAGGVVDYQKGLEALAAAESRARSEPARELWSAQLKDLKKAARDAVAGDDGSLEAQRGRLIARDVLALGEDRWREIKLREELRGLSAARERLERAAGESGLIANFSGEDGVDGGE
jgi:hypothetical protein